MIDNHRVVALPCCEQPENGAGAVSPLTSAERVKRTRERKKKDLLLVTLELRASERAALIRQGFLAPDKARDKQATRDAIYAYLETVLDPSHATTVRNTARGRPVTREQ